MKLMRAKTQTPVGTGDILRDSHGRRYYLRAIHNNKVQVVSMDERRMHVTARPETFNCFLTNL